MVPVHKIETFRGAWDFFGPLNGTSDSEDHFGAQKVEGLVEGLKEYCPFKSPGIAESDNFFLLHIFLLSAYAEDIRKYMSVCREYGKFRVVCCTQNRLRKRGKNLCVHGDDAERHETEEWGYFVQHEIFLIYGTYYLYKMGWIKPKKISRCCPFKSEA
jgi:hypothetical protein